MGFGGDNFKVRATAIVILLLCSQPLLAASDFAIGSTMRSYPLSGVLEADGGYDFLLWGATSSPWYGYLRPHIEGATALSYNSLAASLDFYPLSFFGVRAGGEAIQNDSDYSAYDCKTYICRGRYYRSFVQTELTVGAGSFFAQARWRRERWTQTNSSPLGFMEPTAGLALASGGDYQTIYRGMLGWKFDETWSVAGVLVYTQNDSNRGISRFPFAVIRYTAGDFTLGLGGGVFSSTLKPESGSALLFLWWKIKPSLAL